MQNEARVSSLQEVEDLILSLYQPNPPHIIAQTQATLSRLQGSQQAWELARHLLSRPDEKVKFFGALTIIVKLNTESDSLRDEDAEELLVGLIGWYHDSFTQGGGQLVSRKLASALATFFLHFHRLWSQYIRHIIFCLASRSICLPGSVDPSLDSMEMLASLDSTRLQAVLWVATSVAEDVTKIDLNAANNIGLYDILFDQTPMSVALINTGLSSASTSSAAQQDSIKYLQAWIWLVQKAAARDSQILEALRPLVSTLIDTLSNEHLYNNSIELLTDVLSHYSTLLNEDHYGKLSRLFQTEWAQARYQALIQGDPAFESTQFGQLLLAFGDARVQILMKANDNHTRNIMNMLCGLLAAEGYPVSDDSIFVPAVEFWSTFAETMTDEMYSEEASHNDWVGTALSFVLQAVSHAWEKTVYPPWEEFSQWDSADRTGFNDARKDVVDLLQSTFTLAGADLVVTFADLVLANLRTASWLRLEAAAFCLCGLADCNLEDSRCDMALSSVFTSSLFSVLQTNQLDIPIRTRQTCVSLIEHYTDYFERHVDLLPAALGFLFSMMGEQAMAVATSKSILRLSSSCRHHLHAEAGAFLNEYQRLVREKQLDCLSSERLLGAISCVVQAIPDDSIKFSTCKIMLGFIQQDAVLSSKHFEGSDWEMLPCSTRPQCFAEASDDSPGVHAGLRALRCLASVAKGLQSPTDVAIDLEPSSSSRQNTELRPELVELQHTIISIMVGIQEKYANNPEVTELICNVLRGGLSEQQPGPFVLPPNDVAHYLTKHTVDTPRIGVLVTTACSLISALYTHHVSDKQGLLNNLLLWAIGLARQLSSPHTDPELSQNCIEFVAHITGKNPACLLQLEPSDAAEFFFLFTLQVLDGKEPLPKAAAAEFWSVFVGIKSDSEEHMALTRQAMETLGPLLCQSLARNIGGNASRSELDKLAEPLKKLVSRHPKARDWLDEGLNHPSFPSEKITPEQKSVLVKKLISLRGSRATNQVIREFWLAARGSNFAYAS